MAKKKKSEPIDNSVKFNSFRAIDSIVNYFKTNSHDLNAVTEKWVRQNITSNELLEYYRNKMQLEVNCYRSVVFRMLNMSSSGDKERRENRIEGFKKRIAAIIKSNRVLNQKKGLNNGIENSNFDALKKRSWILDWNCVLFKRGSVVIYSRSDLGFKFKPTTIYAANSIESFNYLKKYLNERLPPIRCSIAGLKLTVIDKINFSDAIQQFAVYARQGVIKVSGTSSNSKITPLRMSFSQAQSKAQKMTPEEFKKYKSEFIDFLVTQQSKDYKVIPCVERLAHTNSDTTEYAFLFSIECKTGDILIVHENVNPDRSTLLFIVEREKYDKCIRSIYDFLQSPEINKRSSLRDKDIEIKQDGVLSYRSINHDILYTWKKTILNYKLH